MDFIFTLPDDDEASGKNISFSSDDEDYQMGDQQVGDTSFVFAEQAVEDLSHRPKLVFDDRSRKKDASSSTHEKIRKLLESKKDMDVEEDSLDEDEDDDNVSVEKNRDHQKALQSTAHKKKLAKLARQQQQNPEVKEEPAPPAKKQSKKKKDGPELPSMLEQTPYTGPIIKTFDELKLSRQLLRAIKDLGYAKPTPVQARTIPIAMTGVDMMVNAVTGSGKTAAFLLPVLGRLLYSNRRVPMCRVLILLPTRELAAQCFDNFTDLAKYTDLRACLVAGGLSLQAQETALRARPDVIIGTPGRLIDHLRNAQTVHFEDIEILILDEADRLLEMGFSDELREIVKSCPRQRQTLLFSATLSDQVNDLINLSLNKPQIVTVDPHMSVVDSLDQEFIRIRPSHEEDREAILLALCKRSFTSRTIIFIQSKHLAHRMMILFGLAGLKAAELHGNLTQVQRLDALEQFRTQKVDFLLCTDLASRGIDIQGVQTVINMSMPREFRQYVHRVGRTARAGRSGRSVSLVSDHQRKILKEVMKRAKDSVKSRVIPPDVITKYKKQIVGFEGDVREIMDQERLERELRKNEQQVNKAANLLTHRDEIMARPARTWFQTNKEREVSKGTSIKQFGVTMDEEEEDRQEAEAQRAAKEKKKDKMKAKADEKKKVKKSEEELEREKDIRAMQAAARQHRNKKRQRTQLLGTHKKDLEAHVSLAEGKKTQFVSMDDLEKMDAKGRLLNGKKPNKKQIQQQQDAQRQAKKAKTMDPKRYEDDYSRDRRYEESKKEKKEKEEATKKKPYKTKSKNAFKSAARYKRRG